MATELTPDLALSIQMLRLTVAEQDAAIERNKAAILELAVRKSRNETNIAAAKKYLSELAEKISATPLETQRQRVEAANQNSTIERQILENLEGAQRAAKHGEVIESSVAARDQAAKNLMDMQNAHGELTAARFGELQKSLGD